MVRQVPHLCLATAAYSAGLMVIDTACNRACCGFQWFDAHERCLHSHGVKVMQQPSAERFQFGAGDPIISEVQAWIPVGIDKKCAVFAVNLLQAESPFLCSISLSRQLDAVLDVGKQVIFFRVLGVDVPLVKVSGHLACCITDFPPMPHRLKCWKHVKPDDLDDPELALVHATRLAPAMIASASHSHEYDEHPLRPGRAEEVEVSGFKATAPQESGMDSSSPSMSPQPHEQGDLQEHAGGKVQHCSSGTMPQQFSRTATEPTFANIKSEHQGELQGRLKGQNRQAPEPDAARMRPSERGTETAWEASRHAFSAKQGGSGMQAGSSIGSPQGKVTGSGFIRNLQSSTPLSIRSTIGRRIGTPVDQEPSRKSSQSLQPFLWHVIT